MVAFSLGWYQFVPFAGSSLDQGQNPTALDAEQWVTTAKMAGAKLVIMVAKHHDGFCLWPSKFTDYSVKNSPWRGGKGDVIADLSKACRKYGMKLGIYLSPWDINSPVYGTVAYNACFKNQLTELLTNYGPIDEVWFDGACGEGPNGKRQVYDWEGYYHVIRTLQPQAVIAIMGPDVRWVGTESGYGRETEWSIVPVSTASLDSIAGKSQHKDISQIAFMPQGDMMKEDLGSREKIIKAEALAWYPSEVDVSIRDGWFYHANQDSTVKSPEKLTDIWYSSVGCNSVLLLNIPPDKRGLISERDISALKGMRDILDRTFKTNLAENAIITRKDSVIELKLQKPVLFDRLLLQENFRNGQHVESFALEQWKNGKWQAIISGTTIGYKRLIRFDAVTSDCVRLRILSSRGLPEIISVKLFKAP
ncbi:MAG: alpha-L-fucosidase [Bacteroidetes bacterium]|nr:alpha-L-fucosidase [Bacteroidota bacterium]